MDGNSNKATQHEPTFGQIVALRLLGLVQLVLTINMAFTGDAFLIGTRHGHATHYLFSTSPALFLLVLAANFFLAGTLAFFAPHHRWVSPISKVPPIEPVSLKDFSEPGFLKSVLILICALCSVIALVGAFELFTGAAYVPTGHDDMTMLTLKDDQGLFLISLWPYALAAVVAITLAVVLRMWHPVSAR